MRFLIYILLFYSFFAQSQNELSVEDFYNSHWQPDRHWSDNDTVVFISIEPYIYDGFYNFSEIPKKKRGTIQRERKKHLYKQRISFDENRKVNYFDYKFCLTGEPLRSISEIIYDDNKLKIVYKIKEWGEKEFKEGVKEFNIINSSKDSITLVLIHPKG